MKSETWLERLYSCSARCFLLLRMKKKAPTAIAMRTRTPTTTPAAIPATFVSEPESSELFSSSSSGERLWRDLSASALSGAGVCVTTTVVPGATLVMTEGWAVLARVVSRGALLVVVEESESELELGLELPLSSSSSSSSLLLLELLLLPLLPPLPTLETSSSSFSPVR